MEASEALAFVDESGRFFDPHGPVIVIAVVVADASERGLSRLLARIRRRLPTKGKRKRERRRAELKFSTTSPKTRREILTALARQPVRLCILIVHKAGTSIEDTPRNFAHIVSAILPECVERFRNLNRVLIDRHFSRTADQATTNRFVLARLGREIEIEHVDSLQDTRIDLADFVAGAVAYAQIHGDTTYEDLLRDKIAVYKKVSWKEKEKW